MNDSTREDASIHEDQWRAWAHMARRREEAAARTRNRQAGVVTAMMTITLAVYYLFVR